MNLVAEKERIVKRIYEEQHEYVIAAVKDVLDNLHGIHLPDNVPSFFTELKQMDGDEVETGAILGIPVKLKKNNYINFLSEFWKIQSLFKKEEIIMALRSFGGEISDSSIESIFSSSNTFQFFTDGNRKFLFAYTSAVFTKKHGPLTAVQPLAALKNYGIDKLEDACEKGYTKL